MYVQIEIGDYDSSNGWGNDNDMIMSSSGSKHKQQRYQRRMGLDENSVRQQYENDNNDLSEEDIRKTVQQMRLSHPIDIVEHAKQDLQYDIHHCPSEIPDNYPIAWNTLEVLDHWNPDNMNVPTDGIYQGLCTIDWSNHEHRKVAYHYQKAEVPFLIHNHTQIWNTAERWSHYEYVHNLLGDDTHRNEHNSHGNHMMYWKLAGKGNNNNHNHNNHNNHPKDWTPPTENVELSFPDWYSKALNVEQSSDPIHGDHYYLRLNGVYGGQHEHGEQQHSYLYDELPFFTPTSSSLFMVDPDQARGINCRFGSKGIIAETHYDMSRNMILMLHGRKRYILAHPEECPNMELYPIGHPSARHSRVNWSDPSDWHTGNFPKGQVNEVVLQAGDALYLPTFWFHFIVSLNMNYQCNARSGITYENQGYIRECGFG